MLVNALRRLSLSGCATLLGALAVSATLAAQQPAATHDAVFDVEGATYSGSTTFVVDKAGAVTGTMKLDSPAIVDAKLNGVIKDGVWTFSYPFTMDNQGQACSGTVAGSGKMSANNAETTGTVTISGNCSPDPLTGTFMFKKKAK